MPAKIDREIAARGGAIRFRTLKRGNRLFREAVVRKAGPRGGHTIVYPADPPAKHRRGSRRRGRRTFLAWLLG